MVARIYYVADQLKKFLSAQAVLLVGISVAALICPDSLGASACLSKKVEAKLKKRLLAILPARIEHILGLAH